MGTVKDIINQRFGKLIVIERSYPNVSNNAMWKCKCDCGKEIIAKGTLLRQGKIQSCGCLQKEKARNANIIDLTGQKFNKLTALYKDNERGQNYWYFQCECGNIKSMRGVDVKNGKAKSCGCLQIEELQKHYWQPNDLIGKVFGRLTVIGRIENNQRGNTRWLCQCECGNKAEIEGNKLLTNNTTSCGCLISKGNSNIKNILQQNNTNYISEYKIKLDNGEYRYYDFAILQDDKSISRFIEFDGEQHFSYRENQSGWNNKENFIKNQQRDKEKNEYALSHSIPLVRIPYWERDNITLEMIMGDQYLVKEDV